MLAHRDASHALCDHAGGARPVASDRALPMGARASRLLFGAPIAPAATLTLQAGFALAGPTVGRNDMRRRRLSDQRTPNTIATVIEVSYCTSLPVTASTDDGCKGASRSSASLFPTNGNHGITALSRWTMFSRYSAL
jgi:hypothetical protein